MRARITFILAAVVVALTWLTGQAHLTTSQASASPFRYTGDGRLALSDPQTGESITVVYRTEKGAYKDEALSAIEHLLRCHGDDEKHPISLKLVELIDHLQDHFGADAVSVVSGYRSPDYNARLRRTLRRVAHDSRHMDGLAMDILLPGVTKQELAAYAESLRSGGVGDYASSRYVHIDVGPIRRW
jgi:uncharacterized protein YcbK (DUF882 family)